jgi:hypothetical protein
MNWRTALRIAQVTGATVALALTSVAPAAADPPTDLTDDGNGRQWMQLTTTVGLTPGSVAQVCPRDGESRCSGSVGGKDLSGWVWATADQVVELMAMFEPALLTADPPQVGGPDYFGSAFTFLGVMQPTFEANGYGFFHASASGWTSTTDDSGAPLLGSAAYGGYPISGGLGVTAPQTQPLRAGTWLWRPAGEDVTAPTITPQVSGTAGRNGWYVSDVSIAWTVTDTESEVTTEGCDPVTVDTDTAGTSVRCTATSPGGTAGREVVVKRDATPPTATCPTPMPEFELFAVGARFLVNITDATSGSAPQVWAYATDTSRVGVLAARLSVPDAAGNVLTSVCPYRVVAPRCNGLDPTIVGNGANNIIQGTAGRDVIVGLTGSDTIYGNGGDDVICGGDGLDNVYGGAGNDWIDGGAGNDNLNGGPGDDFIDGGPGFDSIRGDDDDDTCVSGEVRMSSC